MSVKKEVSPVNEPVFRLQLIYPDGTAIPFDAGRQFERDLVDEIAKRVAARADDLRAAIIAKGVGFFRSEARVSQHIQTTLDTMLVDIARESIEAVMLDLKRETLRLI